MTDLLRTTGPASRGGTFILIALASALAGGCSSGGSDMTGTGGQSGESGQDAARGVDAGPRIPPAGVVAAGVRWFGRVDTTTPTAPRFSWSGTGFVAQISGTGLSVDLTLTSSNEPYLFKAVIDGLPQATFTAQSGSATYPLATGLTAGTHTVELYRQTEGPEGDATLTAITVAGGTLLDPPAGPARLLEVIGDSITCGYGDLGSVSDSDCYPTESHWDSYASVAARALGAEVSTICASGRGVVKNYGGDSVQTMPMIYPQIMANSAMPAWDFHIEPDAVVVNLGTNDISNNKGDPGVAFEQTYLGLLQTVRSKYPHAHIMGIIGPLLSGGDLATIQGYIQTAVQTMNAAGDANVEYFGDIQPQPSSAYACQYHPDVAEQTLMGNQIATELAAKLGWSVNAGG
ncbi:MAG TPA: SGNH/GDSL hydrolase family protein [Polyangia bacterium]|nr:SGNH/GDSL hydrolase family protein [Polyangia bacterium]